MRGDRRALLFMAEQGCVCRAKGRMLFLLIPALVWAASMTSESTREEVNELRQMLVRAEGQEFWTPLGGFQTNGQPPYASPFELVVERGFEMIMLYQSVQEFEVPFKNEMTVQLEVSIPTNDGIISQMLAGMCEEFLKNPLGRGIGILVQRNKLQIISKASKPDNSLVIKRTPKDGKTQVHVVIIHEVYSSGIISARSETELQT